MMLQYCTVYATYMRMQFPSGLNVSEVRMNDHEVKKILFVSDGTTYRFEEKLKINLVLPRRVLIMM